MYRPYIDSRERNEFYDLGKDTAGAPDRPAEPPANHESADRNDSRRTLPIDISDPGPVSRPLKLVGDLFADRLEFLAAAIDELESARDDRQALAEESFRGIHEDMEECEQALGSSLEMRAYPERKRDLERRLDNLKRDRRHAELADWKDMVWLRSEIRKLKREIGSFERLRGDVDGVA